jgi:hypothetical protein
MKRATTLEVEELAKTYQATGAIVITFDGSSANVIWTGCTTREAGEILAQMTSSVRRGKTGA